ncbi:MAG: Gfo/Idh/MocA family oxidoreductase [Candidatus Poseidoniaceae archaeon]|nr:Gfo/Idh/MocA family oxidoreductase [Candidatus Poseidoniaceae archaeon]
MIDVALLGCGRWGQNHLKVLSDLREMGIVNHITAVDISPDARSKAILADAITDSFENVFADLVIVATPSDMHANQARELMEEGFHVLVEKPLGCCEAEAAQVLASAHEYGRVMGVGLLLRFHPAVKLAKELLSNGTLGRLETIRFVRRTTRNAPIGGNVIEALGVHAIDLICHIMGEMEPSAIHAEGDLIESRLALEFAHGIEALIDVAWEAHTERRSVTLVGSQATLRFDLDIHDRAVLVTEGFETTLPCESSHSPLEAELRHIIGAVEAHNTGRGWSAVPDHGAALRGVRWTERAILALPLARHN